MATIAAEAVNSIAPGWVGLGVAGAVFGWASRSEISLVQWQSFEIEWKGVLNRE